MADSEIKAGDTVRLKSGGPLMTVTHTAQQDGVLKIWVAWFDGNESKSGFYPASALEKDDGVPFIA